VQTDPNGLLYMRARYYNPYLCRFLNPDPSGFKGGLNHYAYANGNPVNYLDPSGLDAATLGAITASWLTVTGISPVNFSNPFGIGSDSGGLNYDTASTALNVAGIGQFSAEYGSGTAAIGSNFKFYSGGFYGNQYVSVTAISEFAHYGGYPLAIASVYLDYQNPNLSSTQFGINTTVVGIGLLGGPIGASFGVGYGAGSLIQENVNAAAAGSFQIITDLYYHAPLGPNYSEMPENP